MPCKWIPDTCGCMMEWDHKKDRDMETTLKFVRKCNDHRYDDDPTIIKKENTGKNLLIADVIQHGGKPEDVQYTFARDPGLKKGQRIMTAKIPIELRAKVKFTRESMKTESPYIKIFEEPVEE